MIPRIIQAKIESQLSNTHGKAIVLYGPRQVGKTTLVKALMNKLNVPHIWLNGDESDVRDYFSNPNSTILKAIIGNYKFVVIDEAQRIENIGLCIKLLVDTFPEIKIIATGSSSFELANRINEPLTGRKWEYLLLPISFKEMTLHHNIIHERRLLGHRLIYGTYPEVITMQGQEKKLLKQLSDSYLYKDILTWERINKPDRLEKLIQALALQIGHEVSYNELGTTSGLDNETVERYITLLEKAFIVFRLPAFSRNLRNELKKRRKIYFYDTGIRNAVINNFNNLNQRTDIGGLWENFLVTERFKWVHYHDHFTNRYFWRTTQQQEIDYLEEYDGAIHAYEFKWNPNKKRKIPRTFLKAYPVNTNAIITKDNYSDFLTKR